MRPLILFTFLSLLCGGSAARALEDEGTAPRVKTDETTVLRLAITQLKKQVADLSDKNAALVQSIQKLEVKTAYTESRCSKLEGRLAVYRSEEHTSELQS